VVPGLTVWRHRYCFLGTPLVARTSVEVACEGLVELALHAARFGVLALPWLGDDGPVSAALLAALDESGRRPSLHRSSARAVIRRDGLDVLMSSRHRRDLGRVARRLAEELDAPLELRDRGEEASAVEEFLAIESAGWKGERGTAMAAHGSDAAFFREMCSGFRAAGRLQLLALGDDAHAVSFQCNLLTSEAVFHFKIAFDETFARFKPGTLLELRMLEEFRERMTQQWIDSCAAPDSPQFGRLRTDRRQLGSYVIGARRVVSWTLDHGLVRLAEQHHDQVLA
jgi:hypothetical protein